jgi:CHAT domain/AAA domain
MCAESRSQCRITVSRDMVQITYQGQGDQCLRAHSRFDCQAAMQLHASLGKTDLAIYGRELYDLLLLADPKHQVSAVFARCFDDPSSEVELAIELVDETLAGLLELRWEYLCDPDGRCLALDSRLRLARRLASVVPQRGQPLGEPPRVLAVISSPDNLESFFVQSTRVAGPEARSFASIEAPFLPEQTLGVIAQFDRLKTRGLIADYRILRGPLPPPHGENPALLPGRPTLERIHEVLQTAEEANRPYHVLHVLAHGYLDEKGDGYLLLSDDMGDAALVQQARFRSLFPRTHRVRMVLLAACQSGSGEQRIGRPLAGLAPTFLRVGIPAVIGMQDEISVRGASAFTETFYKELTAHGYVDTAVVEARREMERRVPSGAEWGIPVLYLQDEEPRLLCPVVPNYASQTVVACPFYTGGRINDLGLFFGRQQIVREICSELKKGCSVSVVGESQIGKSSLLYYIYRTCADWGPEGAVEFVDLQGVLDETDFCETVLRRLGESGNTLRDLKRALADRKLILILDEVERLAEGDFSPRLHDLLRSLAQESHFAMCLATERPLDQVFPTHTPGGVSPFYNIFTVKSLGPYTRTEAKELLVARAAIGGIAFTEQEIEQLLTESQCHPAKLQAMAKALFERKLR